MSFGVSASDIVAIIQLATKVYGDYKQSSDGFQELAKDIDDFKSILVHFGETSDLGAQQNETFKKLTTRSEELLNDLNNFHKEYSSLGRNSPRKYDKLRWPRGKAEEFRRRINKQTLTWIAYNSTVTNTSISELCRLVQEQSKERHEEVSFTADPPASKKPESDTGWVHSLVDCGVSHEVIVLVETVSKQSSVQERLQLCENRKNTNAPDKDKEQNSPDSDETKHFNVSFSRSSTLACPDTLKQTPTSSSGEKSLSGDGKKSFFGELPRDKPLAFNPKKTSRRADSVSPENVNVDISSGIGKSSRRASMASLQKVTPNLGSSATSIAQQRSPFGAGFTSPTQVLRSKSEV